MSKRPPGPRPATAGTTKNRTPGSRSQDTPAASDLLDAHNRQKSTLSLVGGIAAGVIVGIVLALFATRGSSAPPPPPPHMPLAPLSTLGPLASSGNPGPLGPEGVPIPNAPLLASTASAAAGHTVDGISCATSEQTLFHIHAHLTIFIDGKPRSIPYGIGIPGAQIASTSQGPFVGGGNCFYWLHTHAADGIIHIESPVVRTFTLGNFFDLWGQPLGPDQIGPEKGRVVAIYNRRVYTGNPRNIPLEPHAQIQLQIGKPLVAPIQITFPNGL